jgi:hypothetical protein
MRRQLVAFRAWALFALFFVLPASGQLLPGVGFNPFPERPDPWDVALSKGLIRSRSTELTWEANPTLDSPHYIGGIPGDPEVYSAWMARYGIPTTQPFPGGAELEQTFWPNILRRLFRHGRIGGPAFSGEPTPREIRDASRMNNKRMACEVFLLDGEQGYVKDNPFPVRAPDLPPGLVLVPARRTIGEPPGFASWRHPYGCDFWLLNSAPPVPPTPDPVPPPIPDPEPAPCPTCPTCPVPEPCPECPLPPPCPPCPACPAPPQLSDDARQTVQWLTTATLLTGPGRRARVARLLRELEALGLMRSKP